jgi:Zn-dependent protease with chaperone function
MADRPLGWIVASPYHLVSIADRETDRGEVDMSTTNTASPETLGAVNVTRWPSETPLLGLVVIAAVGLWVLLAVSVFGLAYALLIGLFLFLSHVAFLAHVRGSGVRLSPEQFPELHQRVQELAARAGLRRAPEAYLVQAGGTLNALATRFLGADVIVLYSELVEACGSDEGARDMVIGHELGHLASGHLRWRWAIAPGLLVPFLGSAWSRACEHTCDRWGAQLCGDHAAALRGLAVLAAGGAHGPRVNLEALSRQRQALDTGWMTLGRWLMSHPPLCDRVAALEPAWAGRPRVAGTVRALAILGVPLVASVVSAGLFVAQVLPQFRKAMAEAQHRAANPATVSSVGVNPRAPVDAVAARRQVDADFETLRVTAEEHRRRMGVLPADGAALYGVWRSMGGDPKQEPIDPFDGSRYGYEIVENGAFVLWSSGPDGKNGTEDDIERVCEPDPR